MENIFLSWLNEPETKERLQHCADYAVSVLHNDQTLRVPRSPEQRESGFAAWRNAWRDRLETAIQDEFSRQFPGIESRLPSDTVTETVLDYVWPQVETELLAFALEGLARSWVRRHMGDATVIGRPRQEGLHWVVPLGIDGYGTNLGQVIVDRDGNVLEEASSSRKDLLAKISRKDLLAKT